jgi:hypothetical protein
MTNDVATNALGGQPVRNGDVVTSVLPTGNFETHATPAPGENQSVGNLQADLSGRLADAGATPVRLQ